VRLTDSSVMTGKWSDGEQCFPTLPKRRDFNIICEPEL